MPGQVGQGSGLQDLSKTYPKRIQNLSQINNLSKTYPKLIQNLSKAYPNHEHIWNLTNFGCSGHERLPGYRVFAPSLHEQASGFSGWGRSGRYGGLQPGSLACWILSPGGAGAPGCWAWEPGPWTPGPRALWLRFCHPRALAQVLPSESLGVWAWVSGLEEFSLGAQRQKLPRRSKLVLAIYKLSARLSKTYKGIISYPKTYRISFGYLLDKKN